MKTLTLPRGLKLTHGSDLYVQLDWYNYGAFQELLSPTPLADVFSLICYLLPFFQSFPAGASFVSRLPNLVYRYVVK